MNRRKFLKSIIKGVAVGTIAPMALVKSLPGISKAMVSTPGMRATLGNTLLTPQIIAQEALRMLQEDLVLSKLVHKEYDSPIKKLDTIKIRRPPKFKITK